MTQTINRNNISKTNWTRPPAILQFGAGNFLKAFLDWMIEVANDKQILRGSVIIVKPTEKGDYDGLKKQEGVFHSIIRGVKNQQIVDENYLISCISDIIHPYQQWEQFLHTAEIPSLEFIVSNTTESGICFNTNDTFGESCPQEFPAKLTRWLFHRFQFFQGNPSSGCYILPCELLEQNGQLLLECVVRYAKHWQLSADFIHWVENANFFCNTLVDKIVTGFPGQEAQTIQQTLGYEDEQLVVGEPYHLWAIEKKGRIEEKLPLPAAGLNVVYTDNLDTFRTLKVSILNGAHTLMVPVAYLYGLRTVRESIEHDLIGRYIQQVIYQEIVPHLPYPLEIGSQYAHEILERFQNPFVEHQLISIALNAISKFKARVIPSVKRYVGNLQQLPEGILTSFAALIVFYKGTIGNESIPLKDNAETLSFFRDVWHLHQSGVIDYQEMAGRILQQEEFWGLDLSAFSDFQRNLGLKLEVIEKEGIQFALQFLLTSFQSGK